MVFQSSMGRRPIRLLDADRLPLLVIDEVQGRKLHQQLRLLIPMSSPQMTRMLGLDALPFPRADPVRFPGAGLAMVSSVASVG